MMTGTQVKVLHLINGEFYAGAERVQDLLALQLGRFGFEVEFACLKRGIFADKRQAQEATLHPLPMKSRADLSLCYRLARLVKSQDVRLLHSHSARTALLGHLVARIARVPLVHHVHSPSERDTEHGLRNLRNSMVENFSLRGARRLVVVSNSLKCYLLERGFDADRITEVPNGVPVSDRRRRSYTPGQELTLGTVALFRPRKGVEILLDAMARLRAAGTTIRLHAVGPFETPDYERSVRQLACGLGLQDSITWTGFSSDISSQFSQMHVFVLPSLFGEGMPMVILEAMAAGLPVVSTRVEGIPQVLRDGQDGLLTESADAQGLADALSLFARGTVSADAMGDSGWHRQRENFSDSVMAARVARIYQEVLTE